ncbi:MAG: hypothetical protein HY900_18670, partial [Deltaproteobacteria bacterium]|nr:hypothetical protein [Deltaproteobacteria bacterium]
MMRVFSVVMWYHFASLTIGLALLGLGGGGVAVACLPRSGERGRWSVWASGFGFGVLALLGFLVAIRTIPELARTTLAPFHQPFYEPFARPTGGAGVSGVVTRLAVLACLGGVPFFCGGL